MNVYVLKGLTEVGKGIVLGLSIFFVSCENASDTHKNEWPQEFYLAKKACYTRYFYENMVNKNQEYELYCNDHSMLSLTKTPDSVCYDDGMEERECLTASAFEERFGVPEELTRIDHRTITFDLDTVKDWNRQLDSNNLDTPNNGIMLSLNISVGEKRLYSKNYNCSRIKQFDPGLIFVYQAASNDSIYFINGEPNCLVLEMEYYDQDGEFGGWEQFSSDIKALRVVY